MLPHTHSTDMVACLWPVCLKQYPSHALRILVPYSQDNVYRDVIDIPVNLKLISRDVIVSKPFSMFVCINFVT